MLPLIISSDQDIIDYTYELDLEGTSLFITLKLFNFDHSFIIWVKCLYTNISTCIYNNGWNSETFYPTRSIRQGCPLSSVLFIVIVEILAIKIRSAENNICIERLTYSGRIRYVLRAHT